MDKGALGFYSTYAPDSVVVTVSSLNSQVKPGYFIYMI